MHSLGESIKKKLRTDNVRHIFTGLSGSLDPEVPPADISNPSPYLHDGAGGVGWGGERRRRDGRGRGEERRWRKVGIRGRG